MRRQQDLKKEISLFLLDYSVTSKQSGRFFQIFESFLEYLKFMMLLYKGCQPVVMQSKKKIVGGEGFLGFSRK